MKEGLKELLTCIVIGISAIFLIATTGSILLIWVLVGVMILIAIRRWKKDRRKIKKMTYKESGVDIEKEEQAIKEILSSIKSQRKEVGKPLSGHYAGLIELEDKNDWNI